MPPFPGRLMAGHMPLEHGMKVQVFPGELNYGYSIYSM